MQKFLFLLISIFIHLLVFFLLPQQAYFSQIPIQSPIPIQIEEKPFTESKQIIDQYSFNHQKPNNTPYLSQHDNTTSEEYKGRPGLTPFSNQSTSDFSVKISNDSSSVFYGRIDHLQNVEKTADQTFLNTREIWFYTFNTRVKHQIYWHWIRELKMELTQKEFYPYLLITHIEAFLDSKGYLDSLIIRKKSGLEELDRASVNAIRKAHPFPNPPAELVSNDGTIRLQYTFALGYED